MPTNTSQIQSLLKPGLAAIFGDYMSYPAQYSEIYETYYSDKAVEVEVEMKFLGLAQVRGEGQATAFDNMSQRYITNYVHKWLALGFAITAQSMEDNLYKSEFPMIAKSFKRSFLQTKEIMGAAVINNGFTTTILGDGQTLFSTAHPIDVGTVSNMPSVATQFNEASLEAAITSVQRFKDQAGLTCMTQPKKLIVPPQQQWVAGRLTKSEFRVDTANNDINITKHMDVVPEGYRVNQFLTSSNAVFLLTDAPNGMKYYIRRPIETDVYTDFLSDNLLSKASERYSFGCSNFRSIYAVSTA